MIVRVPQTLNFVLCWSCSKWSFGSREAWALRHHEQLKSIKFISWRCRRGKCLETAKSCFSYNFQIIYIKEKKNFNTWVPMTQDGKKTLNVLSRRESSVALKKDTIVSKYQWLLSLCNIETWFISSVKRQQNQLLMLLKYQ